MGENQLASPRRFGLIIIIMVRAKPLSHERIQGGPPSPLQEVALAARLPSPPEHLMQSGVGLAGLPPGDAVPAGHCAQRVPPEPGGTLKAHGD